MPFTFNPTTGQYLDGGQPVPAAQVRAAVQTIVADSADRLALLTERLQAGRLDTLGWREAMRRELRTSYGVAASLAQGGAGQMGPAERGVLSGVLRQQYAYLDGFALDLAQGRLTPDEALARARLYAGAAHSAYEQFAQRGALSRGHDQERNVLGAADHCEECRGLADRGWVPIGTLPLPGSRQCLGNCRCSLETQASAEVAA